jgi:hypothetical protein
MQKLKCHTRESKKTIQQYMMKKRESFISLSATFDRFSSSVFVLIGLTRRREYLRRYLAKGAFT